MERFVRLRQVCLATAHLELAVAGLSDVLGVEVCFRSPTIARFGLTNAVLAVNGSFIEILASVENQTSVNRFLDRGPERGAYLLAFDCNNPEFHRQAALDAGVRIIETANVGIASLMQLHPSDTGAAIIEIDRHVGGDQRFGAFEWGGENWQAKVRTDRTLDILGCAISGSSAHSILHKWSQVLGVQAPVGEVAPQLDLDYGYIQSQLHDGVDRVDQIHLSVLDVATVLASARDQGWPVEANAFLAMGVWFKLFDMGKEST